MAKEGLGLGLGLGLELSLSPPGGKTEKNERKRTFLEIAGEGNGSTGEHKSEKKNQVVGWPPVCSYRRKNSFNGREMMKMYVKVSMDGAPFLRKIDLGTHKGYDDLAMALEKLFSCYGIRKSSILSSSVSIFTVHLDGKNSVVTHEIVHLARFHIDGDYARFSKSYVCM